MAMKPRHPDAAHTTASGERIIFDYSDREDHPNPMGGEWVYAAFPDGKRLLKSMVDFDFKRPVFHVNVHGVVFFASLDVAERMLGLSESMRIASGIERFNRPSSQPAVALKPERPRTFVDAYEIPEKSEINGDITAKAQADQYLMAILEAKAALSCRGIAQADFPTMLNALLHKFDELETARPG